MSGESSKPTCLESGSLIDNLRIVRMLGQGSFSISYLAKDQIQGGEFVLKEYFPQQSALRLDDGRLQAISSETAADFKQGLQQFLSEGRGLAGLQHPNIIEVMRCFEANGTAWLQMPFYPGETLAELLQRKKTLDAEQIKSLLLPLLDALKYSHQHSVIHQDIKPANIYITAEGVPLLLDFGATLLPAPGPKSGNLGSPGYAAPEQELGSGPIGPWTDIYGFSASLYRVATGRIPTAASQRLEAVEKGLPDPLLPLVQQAAADLLSAAPSARPAVWPSDWLDAINAGLKLKTDQRPHSVADWSRSFSLLESKPRQSVLRGRPKLPQENAEYDTEGRAWLPIILLGLFALGLIVLVFYLMTGGPDSPSDPDQTATLQQVDAGSDTALGNRDPEQNRRWLEALEADTIYGYQRYRQDYPNSIHEADALQHLARLDDALWQASDAEGSRSAYQTYLEQLPLGRHEAEAMIRLDALDRAATESERQQTLRQEQDNLAWQQARTQRSIAAIDQYIAEFPDGEHLSAAQSLRRELNDSVNDGSAFATARKLHTRKAYQAYIDGFPRGQHVTAALAAIDGLTLRPGKRFRDCDLCPDLVVLAGGSFWQGADKDSTTSLANEKPQRKVVIDKAFAIGIHEVTLAQWDACVADGGCSQTTDNGWGRGARPVMMVSWNDAQAFVEWLSKKTSERYRLPSESEWEYAARAGESEEWPDANPAGVCEVANIAGSETGFRWAHQVCADPFALETAPVGSFPANTSGLHDTLGNVAEWTLDCMSLSYHDAPADGSANNRGLCNSRVTRGGSWFSGARESRLSARFNLKAGDRNDFTGFRVVRELPPSS
ncbi:MAG: bifunctional serine/threonine-protein kinase/formylglycine-generating enzyme family protein [Xanthomonadales bacterium]|nr:bifunctional serine/threonine-protein kinase/formylglycine-generating enzyme family protein [Xanthomonadales bacterium]